MRRSNEKGITLEQYRESCRERERERDRDEILDLDFQRCGRCLGKTVCHKVLRYNTSIDYDVVFNELSNFSPLSPASRQLNLIHLIFWRFLCNYFLLISNIIWAFHENI